MKTIIIALSILLAACGIRPTGLSTTEDTRFSWISVPKNDKVKGQAQTAWQIVLTDEVGKLVWDSGKVDSDENHLVGYSGPALRQQSVYSWKVRVWDRRGKASRWSPAERIITGVEPDSWGAEWINAPWHEDGAAPDDAAPYFRKEFDVRGKVRSATAYVSGLGWFEMYLNGRRVSDDCFVPAFTDYTRRFGLEKRSLGLLNNFRGYRTMYMAYDVTQMLGSGANAAGILVGRGYFDSDRPHKRIHRYGFPRAICRIVIRYEDGTVQAVCSDGSWKAHRSPITFNDLYAGEVYDARNELQGWSETGCDDAAWQPVVCGNAPEGELTLNDAPVDRVQESIAPVSFEKQADGSWKADFGKTISGWVRLTGVRGAAGDTLRIVYPSEEPNGRNEYIFKGDKAGESYAARFTWFVFREAIIHAGDDGDHAAACL